MNVINFQTANCANCYKCLRNCDIKAIRISRGKAQIVQDLCVYCGYCMEICPQGAKTFDSDLDYVKKLLQGKERVVVSLDPSYRGLLDFGEPGQIVDAFLRLGFSEVRETAEGADLVSREYVRRMWDGRMENMISTSCPAVVYLVEKHYPMLIPYLVPVVSPMIAHGRYIKELYGPGTRVVFVGPCVAKKVEAEIDERTRGFVDAVIEFSELEQWLEEAGINLRECTPQPFANKNPMVNQLYCISDGLTRILDAYQTGDSYKKISISGTKGCREFLHSLKKGYVHHCFAELHICDGGCVNGPGVEKRRGSRFKALMDIENTTLLVAPRDRLEMDDEKLVRTYIPKQVVEKMPTEYEIQTILKQIGKSGSSTEFNCGACGYMTCRENAIAIYHGKAEAAMCLVRSYENARSQASVVLQTIPSIIMIVDNELRIKEFNRKAEEVFRTSRRDALSMYLFDFIETADYEEVYRTHQDIFHRKRSWELYDMTVLETIVYIAKSDQILAVIEDVSDEETKAERLMERKLSTVKMAQAVIDRQMTTAQQIAGLLGETTAETKAILTQLRDYILEEED